MVRVEYLRLHTAQRPETRAKHTQAFLAWLRRGEKLHCTNIACKPMGKYIHGVLLPIAKDQIENHFGVKKHTSSVPP